MNEECREKAQLFKALSDSNRVMILEMLKDGEMCACHLLERFQITQPTLSHHMRLLCECDFVIARREGKWMHYSLNTKTLGALSDYFKEMI